MADTDQSAERIAAWQMLGYAAQQLGLGATIAAVLPPGKLTRIADGDAYLCGLAGGRPVCACGCLDVLRKTEAMHRKLADQWAESESGYVEDVVAMAIGLVRRELGDTATLPQRSEGEEE